MRDLSERFKSIQAAAGSSQTKQEAPAVAASGTLAVALDPIEQKGFAFDWPSDPAPTSWPRAEIMAALQKGAASSALTLALQAVADLVSDPSFAAESLPLAKPTKTGEEWKRAYKTYARYAPQLIEAGRKQDDDAACELFSRASQEVSEIYSTVNPGDPMAEQLALAVYEALSRIYEQSRSTAL